MKCRKVQDSFTAFEGHFPRSMYTYNCSRRVGFFMCYIIHERVSSGYPDTEKPRFLEKLGDDAHSNKDVHVSFLSLISFFLSYRVSDLSKMTVHGSQAYVLFYEMEEDTTLSQY